MSNTCRKPGTDNIFKSFNSIDHNACVNTNSNSKNKALKNFTKIKLSSNFKPNKNNNAGYRTKNFSKEASISENKKTISSPKQKNRVSSVRIKEEQNINHFYNQNICNPNNMVTNLFNLNINNNSSITNLSKYVHQVRNHKNLSNLSNLTVSNMKSTSMSNN